MAAANALVRRGLGGCLHQREQPFERMLRRSTGSLLNRLEGQNRPSKRV